ncbi:Secreted and surface protein containing fasciclin-like repeats [Methanosarcina barkeri 227]|uniref:Secreted and surface protein containing fasciclin-like repeats n=2 Tax=Methanosarcina barkeri TaxID=2208 RepID=A0A0E3QVG9_METBA|nr:Secreted and surface protein containing fasciclin-like repeats [Methanosarcina barkeri MS]AKB57294.1 Secreted and surface protein containing fasciclin-like repeats [Methanosarcina barkeri 227]
MLTYYVISGEYRAADLKNINSLASLETKKLAVNATTDGTIIVGDAAVIEPDIFAANGVIHGIDKVLIPL